MAARGVNLSLRDEIIRKLKEDQQRRDQALKPDAVPEDAKTIDVEDKTAKLAAMVDHFCNET